MNTKMFYKILTLLVFLVVTGFLVNALYSYAAGEGDLGAYPTNYDVSNPKTKSWFIYELKPGVKKEDSITIVNNSDRTMDVKVYPVDATTTTDGAFALLNENQKQTEVGSWVKLSKNLVTIAPHDHVDVPFTISIPNNTTVGDHPGGIIIQEAKTLSQSTQGMGLNIVSRVGTRIYETVPGAKIINMDLRDMGYKIIDDHLVFNFTMENLGNVILTPTGTLVVKDYSGKEFDTIQLGNLGSVFPGKPTVITVKSEKSAPLFGQFNATATINYSPTKAISKTLSFIIFIKDWKLALPIPAIILLLVLFMLVKKIFFHAHRVRYMSADEEPIYIKHRMAPAIVQPAHVYTNAATGRSGTIAVNPETNVDAVFISHHVKLLGILTGLSILILSVLIALAMQYLVFSRIPQQSQSSSDQVAPAATAQSTQPASIPAAKVNKGDMQVIVLNGSGKAGAAKIVSEALTKQGFTVIKTGNASESATQTIIEYPKGKIDGADQLKDVLKADYQNIHEEETDDQTYTITLGQ